MSNKVKIPGRIKAKYSNLSANLKANSKTIIPACYPDDFDEEYKAAFTIKQTTKEDFEKLENLKAESIELEKELLEVIESEDVENPKIKTLTKGIQGLKSNVAELIFKYVKKWDNLIDFENEITIDFENDVEHFKKYTEFVVWYLAEEILFYSREIPENIKEDVKS